MLHRDGAGLVVADFRIHIPYDALIDFVCKRVLPIQLFYDVRIGTHEFLFLIVQAAVILCRSRFHPSVFSLLQNRSPALCKQVHGLDLGDLGQNGLLHILLQRNPVHSNFPHLRAVNILILVSGIDQIDHHLRHRADTVTDPEHLVLAKPFGKDNL